MAQEKLKNGVVGAPFEKGTPVSTRPLQRTVMLPFGITHLKIDPKPAYAGNTVIISFQATNTSNCTSIYPVALKLDDTVVAAEVISLPPFTGMPLTFRLVNLEPGKYNIHLNETVEKFSVLGSKLENELAEITGVRTDTLKLETGFEVDPVSQEKKNNTEKTKAVKVTAASPRSLLDKAGDGIENGLDGMGNAFVWLVDSLGRIGRHPKK